MRLKSPTDIQISFGTKSGSGHSMVLGPEGDDVPQMFIQAAFAAGAIPIDESEIKFVSLPETTQGKSSMDSIIDGVKAMYERNNDKDFTAAGTPDRRVLSKLVGLSVTAEDLTKALAKINEPS